MVKSLREVISLGGNLKYMGSARNVQGEILGTVTISLLKNKHIADKSTEISDRATENAPDGADLFSKEKLGIDRNNWLYKITYYRTTREEPVT